MTGCIAILRAPSFLAHTARRRSRLYVCGCDIYTSERSRISRCHACFWRRHWAQQQPRQKSSGQRSSGYLIPSASPMSSSCDEWPPPPAATSTGLAKHRPAQAAGEAAAALAMPVRRVPLQSRSRASRRVSPAVHGAHSGARERVVSHRGAVCGALFGFHCRFVPIRHAHVA